MRERAHNKPDGAWKELGNGTRRRIRSFGEDMMAVEVAFEKGGVGAVHRHAHRQLTYCIKGCFHFTVDGRLVVLQEGDTMFFAGDGEHGCVAQTEGVLLDVFTPVRMDFLEADGVLGS